MNKKHLFYSFSLCFVLPFLIPSKAFTDGLVTYKFGFPFPYIFALQLETKSMWLGSNLLNGNEGISINPLTFIINVFIVYLVIKFVARVYERTKNKRKKLE
ncbi:hypothetical protein [Lentibacillus saliphilus]|uniref:hypothetical protein n=1 Tax=Lentibacillus saliphilus TaxID=2737028 RepID=UPI001C311525|nr:hypothetical protein [Lentibacillus saliphilus]